ncbi:MAG: 3-keto-5-aminohexanoate cleavage protein [Rhodobacteraceae bacterium]|nr:3-keto-5-aminohexanoate cleavage protein [Paracoccaceae bacterium]
MPGSGSETFAPTGGACMPSMPPQLPAAPAGIAIAIIGAAKAGAPIVHPDTRDPRTGKPGPRYPTRSCRPPGNPPTRWPVFRAAPARAAEKGAGTGSAMPVHATDACTAVRLVTVAR